MNVKYKYHTQYSLVKIDEMNRMLNQISQETTRLRTELVVNEQLTEYGH